MQSSNGPTSKRRSWARAAAGSAPIPEPTQRITERTIVPPSPTPQLVRSYPTVHARCLAPKEDGSPTGNAAGRSVFIPPTECFTRPRLRNRGLDGVPPAPWRRTGLATQVHASHISSRRLRPAGVSIRARRTAPVMPGAWCRWRSHSAASAPYGTPAVALWLTPYRTLGASEGLLLRLSSVC